MSRISDFEMFVKTLPTKLQILAHAYPIGFYKIKPDANYKLVCPETIVYLTGYIETGEVEIVVYAKYKRQETIDLQKKMAAKFKYSPIATIALIRNRIDAVVNPVWLEKVDDKYFSK